MDQQSDSPKDYWHTIDDHWSKYDIDPLLYYGTSIYGGLFTQSAML